MIIRRTRIRTFELVEQDYLYNNLSIYSQIIMMVSVSGISNHGEKVIGFELNFELYCENNWNEYHLPMTNLFCKLSSKCSAERKTNLYR